MMKMLYGAMVVLLCSSIMGLASQNPGGKEDFVPNKYNCDVNDDLTKMESGIFTPNPEWMGKQQEKMEQTTAKQGPEDVPEFSKPRVSPQEYESWKRPPRNFTRRVLTSLFIKPINETNNTDLDVFMRGPKYSSRIPFGMRQEMEKHRRTGQNLEKHGLSTPTSYDKYYCVIQ